MTRTPLQLPSDGDASGRDLGDREIALVTEALRSGTLTATKGTFVRRLADAFAECMGAAHGVACASGTAAIHGALVAAELEAGDEVVTTAITDMGAIMPILYEGAVPVFCDVDPDTANVTAEAIAARVTDRTRAIIVTHLFGLPCDMAPILALARERGLFVIEDCAQAPLAEDTAGTVGTLGDVGCFSFQQGKHMTTGEGGAMITSRPDVARRLQKFVDKGWGYGEPQPDHDFPALNGRMTELQGAVGLAQLDKLPSVLARRRASAAWLRPRLASLPGLALPPIRPGVTPSWWRFGLLVDPGVVRGGASALAEELGRLGVTAMPHYIRKPAWRTAVLRAWQAHPVTRVPFERAGRVPEPPPEAARGTERALERLLVLPWNEHYQPEHLAFLHEALQAALQKAAAPRAAPAVEAGG
jgi:dTDP-4-amino-4,6-dideoxygalactose transaminase